MVWPMVWQAAWFAAAQTRVDFTPPRARRRGRVAARTEGAVTAVPDGRVPDGYVPGGGVPNSDGQNRHEAARCETGTDRKIPRFSPNFETFSNFSSFF